MLNPSRACCCRSTPCDCAPGSLTPLASTGYGDFTYLVEFGGFTGAPLTQSRVSQITTRIGDLVAYDDGECSQGMICDCGFCPGHTPDTLRDVPNCILEDEDVEIETRSCGFPITNDVDINIAYIWQPVANYCSCPPQCNQPTPVVYGWSNDTGLGIPKTCIATSNYPKYLLGTIYSSAATIRFRRTTAGISSAFDCDLTASTNDGNGTPTVTVASCRYFHRMGSDGECDLVNPGPNQFYRCRQGGGYYDYGYRNPDNTAIPPTAMCAPDGCCCKSELQIRFRVVMDMQELWWATPSSIYSVKPGSSFSVVMTVTAHYYGCTDSRLYSASSTQPALRNFTLDRATFSFPTIGGSVERFGLGSVPPIVVPGIGECVGGTTPSNSYITTDDGCTTCFSTSSTFDATTAIAMGVPASVAVTRSTP
jgi:hypothetical protein